jgi:hypothetical protein
MAHLASNLTAFSVVERESMQTQISGRPGIQTMTILAFKAEETGMDGRLSMALHAFRGGVAHPAVEVTIAAGDLRMAAIQRKDYSVIESTHPVAAVMTLQTGRSHLLLVLLHESRVVLGMTLRTHLNIQGGQPGGVTAGATEGLLIIAQGMMRQVKSRISLVVEITPFQACRLPGNHSVAKAALRFEQTQMLVWFGMTVCTFTGNIVEQVFNVRSFHQLPTAGLGENVALATSQRSMSAFQRKSRSSVVKMRHAIQTIVTGETNFAKILNMLGDEDGIMIPMTKDAALRRKGKGRVVGKMTLLTDHQACVKIHLMPYQTKAGGCMIKERQSSDGEIKITAAMVGVAIGALLSAQT